MDQRVLDFDQLDQRVRLTAFAFLAAQTQRTSDGVFPRKALATGFTFDEIPDPLAVWPCISPSLVKTG